MYPQHFKDIIIGVLVAYIVIDILLIYAMKGGHPGVLSTVIRSYQDENVGAVIVIGMAMGLASYYVSRKSREHFAITN